MLPAAARCETVSSAFTRGRLSAKETTSQFRPPPIQVLRIVILEWRLAMSQHLVVLLLGTGLFAVLAAVQEPWFLRNSGLHLLWHGTAAAATLSFLISTLAWIQQASERLAWSGRGRTLAWVCFSGFGLSLLATSLVAFGIIVSIAADASSGAFGYSPPPALHGLRWVGLCAPLGFVAPGLACTPWPASVRTVLACIVLAASACVVAPSSSLDPAPVSGNLLAALAATSGSLLLSASLQRAFSN